MKNVDFGSNPIECVKGVGSFVNLKAAVKARTTIAEDTNPMRNVNQILITPRFNQPTARVSENISNSSVGFQISQSMLSFEAENRPKLPFIESNVVRGRKIKKPPLQLQRAVTKIELPNFKAEAKSMKQSRMTIELKRMSSESDALCSNNKSN